MDHQVSTAAPHGLFVDSSIQRVLRLPEFGDFTALQTLVRERLAIMVPQIHQEVAAEAAEVASADAAHAAASRRYEKVRNPVVGIVRIGCAVLIALGGICVARSLRFDLPFEFPRPLGLGRRTVSTSGALVSSAAALLGSFGTRALLHRTQRYREGIRTRSRLHRAREDLKEATDAAVSRAVRTTISRYLDRTRAFALPATAPALVELDEHALVPSTSLKIVEQFVSDHSASAIGLAGARGVGKSAILRRLSTTTEESLGVYVPAPVRYESLDVARTIFERVLVACSDAHALDQRHISDRMAHRERLARLVVGAIAIAIGTGFIVRSILDRQPPDPVEVAGAAFVLFGAGVVSMELMVHRSLFAGGLRHDLHELLRHGYGVVRVRTEDAAVRKTALKGLGSLVDVGEESSSKQTVIDRTRADLGHELERFLRRYLRISGRKRVVIAVDELDKLATTEDLIGVVNELKDLFHGYGTHVLVSISDDALDRFIARGVPVRDAFDSSFDHVVSVSRLRAEEAVALVQARAVGFPAPLALFCHAWAGGLARDVVRYARDCVEVHRASQHTLGMAAVVQSVVLTSLRHRLVALVRAGGNLGSISSDRRETILELFDGDRSVPSPAALRRLLKGVVESSSLDPYLSLVEIAHDVVDSYAVDLPLSRWNRWVESPRALDRADDLARRVASVGDPAVLWAFSDARIIGAG